MRAKQFITESKEQTKDVFVDMFKKFLPLAMEHIGLNSLPRMVFLSKIDDDEQPTFGQYVNDEQTLYVSLANRHPNDILRTIAHELTHYKQDTEHALHADSGETGSEHENQANAVAGIVMRHFNKQYPEYLKSRPVIAESRVSEIFDPKSGFKTTWDTKYASSGQATVKTEDSAGRPIVLKFSPSGNGRAIDFDFFRGGSDSVTGQGEEREIFATVISVIQQYMAEIRKPDYFTFSGKGASRNKLYSSLVRRYAPQWGYNLVNQQRMTDDDIDALEDFEDIRDRFFLRRSDLPTTN